jgi:hypothetical protein
LFGNIYKIIYSTSSRSANDQSGLFGRIKRKSSVNDFLIICSRSGVFYFPKTKKHQIIENKKFLLTDIDVKRLMSNKCATIVCGKQHNLFAKSSKIFKQSSYIVRVVAVLF